MTSYNLFWHEVNLLFTAVYRARAWSYIEQDCIENKPRHISRETNLHKNKKQKTSNKQKFKQTKQTNKEIQKTNQIIV